MRISFKIGILQIFITLLFSGAVVAVVYSLGHAAIARWEDEEIRDNVLRVQALWDERLGDLASAAGDWAPWDDLYAYAGRTGEAEFPEKNLQDTAMANLGVNGVMILDARKQLVYAKAIDLRRKAEIPMDPGLRDRLLAVAAARAGDDVNGDNPLASFVVHGDAAVLFALQSILTSDHKGPRHGILLFYRCADGNFFQDMVRRTRIQVVPDLHAGKETRTVAGVAVRTARFRNEVTSSIQLRDVDGSAGYGLKLGTPRTIYLHAREQMGIFLVLVVVFVTLASASLILVLNRVVHRRVRIIDRFMASMLAARNYAGRVDVPGDDELSRMAATMNAMLDQIVSAERENRQLYETAKYELQERKAAEDRLLRQSIHDSLTGLYNRAYFDEKMLQLAGRVTSLGIVCCDVDGLKFVNDTLGHARGDALLKAMAVILQEHTPPGGTVARIGGDEFVVLIEGAAYADVQGAVNRLRAAVEAADLDMGEFREAVSLAVGWVHLEEECLSEEKLRLAVKQADDSMYRQKLSRENSSRYALTQGMREMLRARDFITEGHSLRLQAWAVSLAKRLDLSETQMTNLMLLAQFHDIGKIGVPDAILFKKFSLSDEEQMEMRRHAEIGYRIAQSSPELAPISQLILKHHEWWNGAGYPLGLKGDEIPVEDRILAVVDAYDAMTNDRPYRKGMDPVTAVGELRRASGTQLDPRIVEEFVRILKLG